MRRFHSLESRRIRRRRKKIAFDWEIGYLGPHEILNSRSFREGVTTVAELTPSHRAYSYMAKQVDGVERNKFTLRNGELNFDGETPLGNCGNRNCICCSYAKEEKKASKRRGRYQGKLDLKREFQELEN